MRPSWRYVLALLASCHGSETTTDTQNGADGSSASIAGAVGGHAIAHPSAAAIAVTGSGPDASYVAVYVSDAPLSCPTWQAPHALQTRLDIYLFSPTGAALAPGTYMQYAGTGQATQPFAGAFLHVYDAVCTEQVPSADVGSRSGTLTITELSARIAGSFDFTFTDGRYTGSFEVPACGQVGGDSGTPDGGTPCL